MKKFAFIILLFIISISVFFLFTGEYGLGTRAQETEQNFANEMNEEIGNNVENPNENNIDNKENISNEESDNNEENSVNKENNEGRENNDDNEIDSEKSSEEENIAIEVPITGTEPYYKDAVLVDEPDSITALVNKKNVLPSDYEPDDLVKLSIHAPGRTDAETFMRKEAADAVVELVNTAEAEAQLEILPASAYRSYELQTIIFQNNVNSKGSIEKANKTSALPGQSEHQTGLAVDMSCSSVGFQIKNAFGETEEAKWLAENAYRFGFIIRYPEGKTDITGYSYEPWHLRYVGKDTAKEIFDNQLTLEEYINGSYD